MIFVVVSGVLASVTGFGLVTFFVIFVEPVNLGFSVDLELCAVWNNPVDL